MYRAFWNIITWYPTFIDNADDGPGFVLVDSGYSASTENFNAMIPAFVQQFTVQLFLVDDDDVGGFRNGETFGIVMSPCRFSMQ